MNINLSKCFETFFIFELNTKWRGNILIKEVQTFVSTTRIKLFLEAQIPSGSL